MKTKFITLLIAVVVIIGTLAPRAFADDQPSAKQHFEYAVIKWDGPDRIQVLYPNQKVEMYRVFEKGVKLPADAKQEEFCVTYAVNELAKNGWEAFQLHATRVMLRRALP